MDMIMGDSLDKWSETSIFIGMESVSTKILSQPTFLHSLCGEQTIQQNKVFNKIKGFGSCAASNNQDGNSVHVKRSIRAIQASGKGVKRSCLATTTNGAIRAGGSPERGPFWINEQKNSTAHIDAKGTNSKKIELGVAVPIKKRRIQLNEVLRSPSLSPCPGRDSSPLRSDSPSSPSLPLRSFSPVSPSLSPPLRSPSSASPILESQSPHVGSASPPPKSSQAPPKSGFFLELSSVADGCVTTGASPCINETVRDGHVLAQLPNQSLCNKDHNQRAEVEEQGEKSEKDCLDSNMAGAFCEQSVREVNIMHTDTAVETSEAVLIFSSDHSENRLHWDLNMEMEAWERPTEQATGSKDEAIVESSCVLTSVCSYEKKNCLETGEGSVKMQLDESKTDEHADFVVLDPRVVDCSRVESKEGMPMVLEVTNIEEVKITADSDKHPITGSHQLPSRSEAEEHLNCEELNSEDLESGRATSRFAVDSDLKSEKAIEVVGGAEEMDGMQKRDVKTSLCNTQMLKPSSEKQINARTARLTSWDQMLKGSNRFEEACKAAKENTFHYGNGELSSSPIGGGSLSILSSVPGGSHLGSGRGTYEDSVTSVTGGSFVRKKEMEDSVNTRSTNGFSDRGSAHIWTGFQLDALDRQVHWWRQATRGFSLHERAANATGMGTGKLESSAMVVAPHGTDTKHGSRITVKHDNVQSMCGFYYNGDGPLERGPLIDIEAGINLPFRVGVGSGRKMSDTFNTGMDAGGGSRQRVAVGNLQGPYHGSEGLGLKKREFQSNSNRCPSHSFRTDSRVERSSTQSNSIRVWHDPAASKWAGDERETHNGNRCFQRPVSRSRYPRTSPNVVHGSSLMDERDTRILAGGARRHSSLAPATKNRERSSAFGWLKEDGEDKRTSGTQPKQKDHSKTNPRYAYDHEESKILSGNRG